MAIRNPFRKGKPKGREDPKWSEIKNHYDLGVELRRPFERRWIINLAFLAGKQYVFFNQSVHLLQQLKRVKGRIRNVDNQLTPRWKRQVSDLIATSPIMSVVPDTNDDLDIKAAKVGNKVLKSFWQNAKMKKKVRKMGGWIYSVGNVFLDDRWNPKLGPIEIDPTSGKPQYAGDVDCGVWSPFEILVPFSNLGDDDLHAFPWLMKVKFRQLGWLAKNYKRGGEVVAESLPLLNTNLTSMLGYFSGEAPSKVPGAMLMELYIQPCEQYPKGKFLAGANGVVLEEEDWPINYYHIEHFKDLDVPGVFWGKATLDDAVGLQKTWNRTVSSIDEFNRIVAKGKGLVPRGAKLDTLPDDTHGEWIEYTPVLGHKPEYMTHKGLPQTMLWSLETTQRSFQDLYSQHEVTRGTNKSDLRSGSMAQFLREQDARGSIPTHAVFEEGLEATMGRVLKRIQQGYTTERMLKIEGDEGEFDVFAFKGADLRNNTDVSVRKDSSLPDSRTFREAAIYEKYNAGLYGPPDDPKVRRRVLRMLEDAETTDVFNDLRLDETYANWENRTMFESPDIDRYLINQYDNHAVHIEEHNRFRKTMEYQKVKAENPSPEPSGRAGSRADGKDGRVRTTKYWERRQGK
jgi:hypothetical protein